MSTKIAKYENSSRVLAAEIKDVLWRWHVFTVSEKWKVSIVKEPFK